jgi:hypothetical protein
MNAVTQISNKSLTSALNPTNLEEAMRFAELLSKSSIVPKDYQGSPGNILIAIQWGMEIGLQPLQALQNIAAINGRPCLWGDAMLALVRGSGLLESIQEDVSDQEATCTVKRKGATEPVSRTFTIDDAKKAGLLGKQGPWQQYPKRMMQMRARSWALRDEFTDVLKGIASAEEQSDVHEEKDITPTQQAAPQAATIKDKLRQRIAKPASVTVLDRIRTAQTLDELNAVKADAAGLPDAERTVARRRFAERKAELTRAQDAVDTTTGEIIDPSTDPEYADWIAAIDEKATLDDLSGLVDAMPPETQLALAKQIAARREQLGIAA